MAPAQEIAPIGALGPSSASIARPGARGARWTVEKGSTAASGGGNSPPKKGAGCSALKKERGFPRRKKRRAPEEIRPSLSRPRPYSLSGRPAALPFGRVAEVLPPRRHLQAQEVVRLAPLLDVRGEPCQKPSERSAVVNVWRLGSKPFTNRQPDSLKSGSGVVKSWNS
jgi:hypothetical protein